MATQSDDVLGTRADKIDLGTLNAPALPEKAEDGRTPTLNGMGCATEWVYGISQEFVDFASRCKRPVLDGGAAYGAASVAALKGGATVIANDLCKEQLAYLVSQVADCMPDALPRLYIKPGALPDGFDLPKGSLDAVHLSRVMHFFGPEEVEKMMKNAHEWLATGGKLFIITMSPWHHAMSCLNLGPEYERRLRAGERFPGIGDDFGSGSSTAPGKKSHAIDPTLIARLAIENNFMIEKVMLCEGPENMDYTGAVLVK